MIGRCLLAVLLCVATVGALWVMPRAAGQIDAPPRVPQSMSVDLEAALPPVAQLQLDAVPGPATPAQPGPAQLAPPPDPLALWAAETAPLLGIPEPELIGYGAADLAMQDRAPDCQLSWITLAALGRVGAEVPPDGGIPAAIATAETLCAGGRDTMTDAGWESAVRSVGEGTAYVHQVFAAATVYATAVGSGVPISPPAQAAINFAIDQIGLPYIWGGNGPLLGDAGFDCSGLTTAAYATAGVRLPRTAHTQYFATRQVSPDEPLLPGDLVFYGNPATKIHHVGLYIGNGQMINAPTFGMPVQVAAVRDGGRDFAGVGRPVG